MYLRVAHRARLVLSVLVVKARRFWNITTGRQRMALQTKQIHLAYPEQTRIRRTVRSMATGTPLLLHRNMLECERTHGLGVAIRTHREFSCGSAQLPPNQSAVRVMAVAALNQPNIHPVSVRPGKFRFLGRMAAIAQKNLFVREQVITLGCVVW